MACNQRTRADLPAVVRLPPYPQADGVWVLKQHGAVSRPASMRNHSTTLLRLPRLERAVDSRRRASVATDA